MTRPSGSTAARRAESRLQPRVLGSVPRSGLTIAGVLLASILAGLAAKQTTAVDWVVIATVATALATLALAYSTRELARQTQSDVSAAWELLEETRRQGQRLDEPTLVLAGAEKESVHGSDVSRYVAASILNLGPGPALDVEVTCVYNAPIDMGDQRVLSKRIAGIPANAKEDVLLYFDDDQVDGAGPSPTSNLDVPYNVRTDTAWTITCSSRVPGERYSGSILAPYLEGTLDEGGDSLAEATP